MGRNEQFDSISLFNKQNNHDEAILMFNDSI